MGSLILCVERPRYNLQLKRRYGPAAGADIMWYWPVRGFTNRVMWPSGQRISMALTVEVLPSPKCRAEGCCAEASNQLTDVKGLENLTQLTHLDLEGNPDLTKSQIDELKKALPKCRILSNPKS